MLHQPFNAEALYFPESCSIKKPSTALADITLTSSPTCHGSQFCLSSLLRSSLQMVFKVQCFCPVHFQRSRHCSWKQQFIQLTSHPLMKCETNTYGTLALRVFYEWYVCLSRFSRQQSTVTLSIRNGEGKYNTNRQSKPQTRERTCGFDMDSPNTSLTSPFNYHLIYLQIKCLEKLVSPALGKPRRPYLLLA